MSEKQIVRINPDKGVSAHYKFNDNLSATGSIDVHPFAAFINKHKDKLPVQGALHANSSDGRVGVTALYDASGDPTYKGLAAHIKGDSGGIEGEFLNIDNNRGRVDKQKTISGGFGKGPFNVSGRYSEFISDGGPKSTTRSGNVDYGQGPFNLGGKYKTFSQGGRPTVATKLINAGYQKGPFNVGGSYENVSSKVRPDLTTKAVNIGYHPSENTSVVGSHVSAPRSSNTSLALEHAFKDKLGNLTIDLSKDSNSGVSALLGYNTKF